VFAASELPGIRSTTLYRRSHLSLPSVASGSPLQDRQAAIHAEERDGLCLGRLRRPELDERAVTALLLLERRSAGIRRSSGDGDLVSWTIFALADDVPRRLSITLQP